MVDQVSKKAAELLMEELSDPDNKVSETIQPLLSDAQQMLKVPPHLIYICGLVMEVCHCEAAPPGSNPTKMTLSKSIFSTNPTVAMELFETWQQCYNHGMERKQNQGRHQYAFCPSPILVPSHMVQLYIRQELQQAHCRLAQKAMNELLEEEKAIREKLAKPKSTRQVATKLQKHRRSASESTFPTQQQQQQRRNTETLQELLRPPVMVQVDHSSSLNEGEWTKVGERGAKSFPHRRSSKEEELPYPQAKKTGRPSSLNKETYQEEKGIIRSQTNQTEHLSPTDDSTRLTSRESTARKSPEGGRARSPATQVEDPLNAPTLEKKRTTATKPTILAASTPTHAATSSLTKNIVTPQEHTKRVSRGEHSKSPSFALQALTQVPSSEGASTASLERKVEELQQQLEQERKDHARAMQIERERTEERCQALQLRLYISETRLKTFEDALRGHVEAVANNTAMKNTDTDQTMLLRFNDENNRETSNTDPSLLPPKNNNSSPLLSRLSSRKEVHQQEKELQ